MSGTKLSASAAVCSLVNTGASGQIGCKVPFKRQIGWAFTARWTSDAPAFCPISRYSSTCLSGWDLTGISGAFAVMARYREDDYGDTGLAYILKPAHHFRVGRDCPAKPSSRVLTRSTIIGRTKVTAIFSAPR